MKSWKGQKWIWGSKNEQSQAVMLKSHLPFNEEEVLVWRVPDKDTITLTFHFVPECSLIKRAKHLSWQGFQKSETMK